MALTLNNFIGFESGGLEEASGISSAPQIVSIIVRTGTFELFCSDAASDEAYIIDAFEGGGDQGDYYLVGFGFAPSVETYGGGKTFFSCRDTSPTAIFYLKTNDNGEIEAYDANDALIGTSTFTFTAATYCFIEIAWQNLDNAIFKLYVNDNLEIDSAGDDLDTGTAIGDYALWRPGGIGFANHYYDDFYCFSGASGAGDLLGSAAEVLGAYQNTVEDATDQGSALDQGTWAIAGDTPGVDDGAPAGYEAGGAETGYTICDEGARDGPDGDIIGDVEGGKWLHRLQRGAGSGTNHFKRWGKNAAITDTAVALTAAWVNYIQISEDGTFVPTINTDYFSQGMRKDTGGREIYAADIWSFLLHVDAGVPPTGQPTPIRTQGTPTGSGYRDRIGGWN